MNYLATRKTETVRQTIDSREIAEMLEMKHYQILEKLEGTKTVKGIIPTLTDHNFVVSDYFQESTYKDASGKENKCYLFTKMGCEFVANKFTGEKGIIFSAKYVKRFNQLEQGHGTIISALSPQLQLLINIELQQQQQQKAIEDTNKRIDGIKDIIALNPNDWRKDTARLLNKMAVAMGGYEHLRNIREESYKLLDERFGVSLSIRLTNKKKTVALNGVCKSKVDKLNKLDAISDDKKLIEGYISIIKEMCIRYGVDANAS